MRTVLTRFFPFSQDQTPMWNEFWYHCNITLRAKRCPAIAGHGLSVIREQKISWASLSKAFRSRCLSGETEAPRNTKLQHEHRSSTSGHLILRQKRFLWLPPLLLLLAAFCCRIICSRSEAKTLCFLVPSLLGCLLLQFPLSSLSSTSLPLHIEADWPFCAQISNSWPYTKWRVVFIAWGLIYIWVWGLRWGTAHQALSCLLPATVK